MEKIRLKSQKEIKILREGGKILYEILHKTGDMVKPGVSTGELNEYAEKLLLKNGVEGAFKGYAGFPSALCTSVNDACVHGIPSFDYILKDGDIVGLDFGVIYKGLITDSAITVSVGAVGSDVEHFMKTAETALMAGIRVAQLGNTVGDIGAAVQKVVEKQGYNCVRDLIGHGVGYEVHESPGVPNVGKPGDGASLEEGLVIAIEPIINNGGWKVRAHKDKWTMLTADGSISAHYEHTIAVTKKAPIILTAE